MINSELLAQVVLQITLSSIFICLFFFTYGKTQEEKSMERQIEFLINDVLGDTAYYLSAEQKSKLKQMILNINPDTSVEDQQVNENNAVVWNKTVRFMVFMFIVGGFIVYHLWRSSQGTMSKFNIKKTIFEAFLALAIVAVTEFAFLTYLGSEYITISPNKIKAQILINLKNYVYSA